jgi:3-hydroxyacyl-CoA dehydrogenase
VRGRGEMADGKGQVLRIGRIGPVLEIVLCHPPANALGARLRRALADALDQAEATKCGAVLIRGEGALFSAGADLAEMGADTEAPRLGALCNRIEGFSCPVVVLIGGVALGGGAELALAAHLRLATEEARLGFPEVTLGLVPGAGGTQRLPRLVGAEAALDLMLSGRMLGAAEALAMGLVDRMVTGDARAAALEAARELGLTGGGRRTGEERAGFRDVTSYRAAVAAQRDARRGARPSAADRIVDCVEAALLLPLEQGLAFEGAAFGDLTATTEAQALRYLFRAERAARRLPAPVAAALPGVAVPQRLALWGAGGEAVAIARAALQAGMTVVLADPSKPVLVAALEEIAAAQEAAVKAGRLSAEARDADWARLLPAVGLARLGEGEVVLTTRPDLALTVARAVIALGVPGPKGAIGLSLVAQPKGPTLAELALGGEVAVARAAQAVALGRRLGWAVVPVGPGGPVAVALATALAEAVAHLEARGVPRAVIAQGLALAGIAGEGRAGTPSPVEEAVARRCFAALANAGARLIEAGTAGDASVVDVVAIAAGIVARWTGGPMHRADQRGLMVLRRDLRVWAEEAPGLFAPAPLLDRLISEGRGFSGA